MNYPDLTMKTVKALVQQELGTTKGLYRETGDRFTGACYKMPMGAFMVIVENNWLDYTNHIRLTISGGGFGEIVRLYDRNTLQEDTGATIDCHNHTMANLVKEKGETYFDLEYDSNYGRPSYPDYVNPYL